MKMQFQFDSYPNAGKTVFAQYTKALGIHCGFTSEK
jgi:hypothetical protein